MYRLVMYMWLGARLRPARAGESVPCVRGLPDGTAKTVCAPEWGFGFEVQWTFLLLTEMTHVAFEACLPLSRVGLLQGLFVVVSVRTVYLSMRVQVCVTGRVSMYVLRSERNGRIRESSHGHRCRSYLCSSRRVHRSKLPLRSRQEAWAMGILLLCSQDQCLSTRYEVRTRKTVR